MRGAAVFLAAVLMTLIVGTMLTRLAASAGAPPAAPAATGGWQEAPHACPRCGGPAYVGFASTECQRGRS
jgi:hypothetical protein